MDKVSIVNCCMGIMSFMLLQGVINVDGRTILTSGNRLYIPKDDAEVQSKILSLLLHKGLVPVERNEALGIELTNKLSELDQLEALRENLELEREITATLVQGKAMSRKRGEPCFWKYCV